MGLNIEDGTLVANANSYIDLAFARSYASDRGITLDADDVVLTPMLIKACDYLQTKASLFVGCLVSVTQSLAWPRQNVLYPDGTAYPINKIPDALKAAQAQLVIEQFNEIDLIPTQEGKFVVSESVDVIRTSYSEKIGTSGQPYMPLVDSLLSTLMYTSGAYPMRSIRV